MQGFDEDGLAIVEGIPTDEQSLAFPLLTFDMELALDFCHKERDLILIILEVSQYRNLLPADVLI